MRCLTYDGAGELYVTRDLVDIPRYAILSHTWGTDEEEVTYQEVQQPSSKQKPGYKKIEFCGQQAKGAGLQHFWVDTCCIDKTNHVELSEAITSMYRWYQKAEAPAIPGRWSWTVAFRESRWFTRGWTLQELLAPKEVVFFSNEGQRLGSKSSLEGLLHEITSIPIAALRGQSLGQFSVTERMRWTKNRTTKKKEDQAYCLLRIFNVYLPLIYGEGDNAFVRLTDEINKLPKATFSLRLTEGATFDAYGQTHRECHPATRIHLLQSVRSWAQNANSKSIFWLNGMAGTGKSTISWTIAKWLADLGSGGPVALGASFFFKRGEGDRASARLLFPTIASQLAEHISHFDVFLAQAVKAHPQICNKSLGEQFKKLIYEPLQQLRSETSHATYVVVVDALDECDNETDIRTVLLLWSSLPVTNCARLRLFVTSRPETVIRLGFKAMSSDIHQDMVLHEIPQPVIQHDILAFLTDELGAVRDEYNLEPAEDLLIDNWPGPSLLRELADMAIPLFIAAATICRFIREAELPQEGLNTILTSRKTGHLSDIGKVYSVVLRAIIAPVSDRLSQEKGFHEFRLIVGTIICLAEPLSRRALAALLDISATGVQLRLRSLHAVLQVPEDGNALIRPLHLSFAEYLTSQGMIDQTFGVDAQATHYRLWGQCLKLLSSPGGLREDICGLRYPGQLRHEICADLINQHLPLAVKYACRYWVYHVQSSTFRISDSDEVHTFLRKHFIHWLEALSLLNRLSDAVELVNILQSKVQPDNSSHVTAFLTDARRFVLSNRYIGELAPLQLYSSAITFAPQNSIVRTVCGQFPSWLQRGPVTPSSWSPELQKLEGHTGVVSAVTFSPDGLQLASASSDKTVRLWDAKTGQEVQELEGHTDRVNAVAFSPDGSQLASVSSDKTVRLWDAKTGQELQKFGDLEYTSVVRFSPDSTMLTTNRGYLQIRRQIGCVDIVPSHCYIKPLSTMFSRLSTIG